MNMIVYVLSREFGAALLLKKKLAVEEASGFFLWALCEVLVGFGACAKQEIAVKPSLKVE